MREDMMTKEEATRRAKAMLKKMTTPGWKIRVHENLGWHYSIIKPHISISEVVYPRRKPIYYCMLCPEPNGAGTPAVWNCIKDKDDPNKALEASIKALKQYLKKETARINTILEAAGV